MSDNTPFFSIIIPFTNYDNFLLQAIDSVMMQSYRDFELLLIDETGEFENRVTTLEYSSDNIRYFKNSGRPGGGYSARNLGIEQATGDWIAFLDSDDLWSPDQLQAYVNCINNTYNVCLVCTNWIVCGRNFRPKIKGMKPLSRKVGELTFEQLLMKLESGADFFNTNVICIDHKLLTADIRFPEYGKNCMSSGDGTFWLTYLKSNMTKRLAWDSLRGAVYWQHNNNRASRAGRYMQDNCYINYLIMILGTGSRSLSNQMKVSIAKILSTKCGSRLIRVKINDNFAVSDYASYLKYILLTHKYGLLVFLRFFILKIKHVFNSNT